MAGKNGIINEPLIALEVKWLLENMKNLVACMKYVRVEQPKNHP